jgi:hypothetical protein
MGWRDLLQTEAETLVVPWLGGRSLRSGPRRWKVEGRLPPEHGWAEFGIQSRTARFNKMCDPSPEVLKHKAEGYLVGDRLVPSTVRAVRGDLTVEKVVELSERVHLLEPGLDRFTRVSAGRMSEDGPLVFIQQEMPLGPEWDVSSAFLDEKPDVSDIKEVSPALEVAFYLESWRRAEAVRRRQELEEQRRLEEEARQREERRREIAETLGDGAGRRALAQNDFEGAARAALGVGGAEYLDHRTSHQRREMVVKYRLNGRRYECTCDSNTLQVIDAGICLTAHYDDPDFEEGTKGDTWLTLETLPGVVAQAEREGKLVVFRHVD